MTKCNCVQYGKYKRIQKYENAVNCNYNMFYKIVNKMQINQSMNQSITYLFETYISTRAGQQGTE